MRQITSILLLITLFLGLAACGGGGSAPVTDDPTETTDDDTQDDDGPQNDDGNHGDDGENAEPTTAFGDESFPVGTYWVYRWDYSYISNGSPTDFDGTTGTVRIEIVDMEMAYLPGLGDMPVGLTDYTFETNLPCVSFQGQEICLDTPLMLNRWAAIAGYGDRLYAGFRQADGTLTMRLIVDFETGEHRTGGGFTGWLHEGTSSLDFLADKSLPTASGHTLDTVEISEFWVQTECEEIAGEEICYDRPTLDQRIAEYYAPGLGFVGWIFDGGAAYSGPLSEVIYNDLTMTLESTSLGSFGADNDPDNDPDTGDTQDDDASSPGTRTGPGGAIGGDEPNVGGPGTSVGLGAGDISDSPAGVR